MRLSVLALAFVAALICLIPVSASKVTIQTPMAPPALMPDWNLVGLPGVPVDPLPELVLAPNAVDQNLFRFDAPTQGLILYDDWAPEWYGNMLLTDGFWLRVQGPARIAYTGLDDTEKMDICISLPKAGWTLIGMPFKDHEFPWDKVKISDGARTVSLEKGSDKEWINTVGYWWDSLAQGLMDIGIARDFPQETNLRPWHGYWIESWEDALALILEADKQVALRGGI